MSELVISTSNVASRSAFLQISRTQRYVEQIDIQKKAPNEGRECRRSIYRDNFSIFLESMKSDFQSKRCPVADNIKNI